MQFKNYLQAIFMQNKNANFNLIFLIEYKTRCQAFKLNLN